MQDFLDKLSILDESYLNYFCNYQKECLCKISNSYLFTFFYKVIPLKETKTLNKILDELFTKYPSLQKFKCNRHKLIFTENQIYHAFKDMCFFYENRHKYLSVKNHNNTEFLIISTK